MTRKGASGGGPQPSTYTASDGTTFTDRSAYRRYEFELSYCVRNRADQTFIKRPGTIQGQPFDLSDLENCEVQLLCWSDMVQVDNVRGSKILVAASSESVFIRNCSQCVFSIACKQLRTRDCHDCIFFLYSKTEPVIELSDGLTFAPFNVAYPGHAEQMASAGLDSNINFWSAIFDFNDEARTGEHWRIRDELLEGPLPMWYPLGDPCLPSVPISPSPLMGSQPPRELGGMASFGITTMMQADAQKLAPPSTQVSTSLSKPKKSAVGWDPSRLASPPSAPPAPPMPPSGAAPPPPAPPTGKQVKSRVGWSESEEGLTATANTGGQASLTSGGGSQQQPTGGDHPPLAYYLEGLKPETLRFGGLYVKMTEFPDPRQGLEEGGAMASSPSLGSMHPDQVVCRRWRDFVAKDTEDDPVKKRLPWYSMLEPTSQAVLNLGLDEAGWAAMTESRVYEEIPAKDQHGIAGCPSWCRPVADLVVLQEPEGQPRTLIVQCGGEIAKLKDGVDLGCSEHKDGTSFGEMLNSGMSRAAGDLFAGLCASFKDRIAKRGAQGTTGVALNYLVPMEDLALSFELKDPSWGESFFHLEDGKLIYLADIISFLNSFLPWPSAVSHPVGEVSPSSSPLPQLRLPPLARGIDHKARALGLLIQADVDAATALPKPLLYTKYSTDRSSPSGGAHPLETPPREQSIPAHWASLAMSPHIPNHLVLTLPGPHGSEQGSRVDMDVYYHPVTAKPTTSAVAASTPSHLPEILTEDHQLSHVVFQDEFGEVVVPAYSGSSLSGAEAEVVEVSAGLGRLSLRPQSPSPPKDPPQGNACQGPKEEAGRPLGDGEEPWLIELKHDCKPLEAVISQGSVRLKLFFDSAVTLARFSRYVSQMSEGEEKEVSVRPQSEKYRRREYRTLKPKPT